MVQLGPLLDAHLAKAKENENTKKIGKLSFTTARPTVSPHIKDFVSHYPDNSHIEINEEFFEQFMDCDTSQGPKKLMELFENMS